MLYKVATAILSELPFGGLITSLLDCIKEGKAKGEAVDEKLRALDEGLSKWVVAIGVANNVRTTVEDFRDDIRKKQQDRKDLGEEASSDRNDNDRNIVNDAIDHFEQGFDLSQSAFLGDLLERIEHAKSSASTIDDQLRELDNVLTEWLEAVSGRNAMNPVGEMQITVEDLHGFVHNMINHRKERVMNTFRNNKDNGELDSKISDSMQKIQFSAYRMIANTFLLASQTHVEVVRIGKIMDVVHDIVKRLELNGVKPSADEINEIELLARVYKRDGKPDDLTKLMHLFSKKPAAERLNLSLQFIRLDDDDAKLMGLFNLGLLLKNDSRDLDISDALIHLIELARDVNGEVKKEASAILKTIAEKNELKTQFFKRVRVLSESEANKHAIAETTAALIVDCARKVRKSKESRARYAFDALRMLMKTKSCRLAIAEAGGIPALAEIYKGTAELIRITENNPKSTKDIREWKTTNKQAIDVLIALARDDESQGRFASETIWPLFHCIDKVRIQYHPLDIYLDEDGVVEDIEPNVVTVAPSDQKRVRRAGEALWQLSLIDKFKSVIISLSKVLIVKSINDIDSILEKAPDKNGFDDLHSWAIWIRDMDSEKFVCDRIRDGFYGDRFKGRNLSQIELYSTICTSFRNLLWSLILDGETAVAVAACWYDTRFKKHRFDYMKDVEPEKYRGYWVKSVLQHVDLPEQKSYKNVSRCLELLLKKLGDSNASVEQKERAAKVLWFCSLAETINDKTISSSFSELEGAVVERCKELIQAGTPAQIFWATGILANVAWFRSSPQDVAVAVVNGAQCIVANGSEKFAFMAQYVADHEPGFDVSIENEGLYFDSSFYDDLERKRNAADESSSDDISSDESGEFGIESDESGDED